MSQNEKSLTLQQIIEIKRLIISEKNSSEEVAEQFGISVDTIDLIFKDFSSQPYDRIVKPKRKF